MAENRKSRSSGAAASSKRTGSAGTGKKKSGGNAARSAGSGGGSRASSAKSTGSRSAAGKKAGSASSAAGSRKAGTGRGAGSARGTYTDYSLAWEIVTWVVIAVSVLLFISTLGFGGQLGKAFAGVSFGLFGIMAYIFPFALFLLASFFVSNHSSFVAKMKVLGWILLFVTLCGVMQLILVGGAGGYSLEEYYEAGAAYRTGGGLTGGALTMFFTSGIGIVGTWIVYVMLLIISLILITQKSFYTGVKRGGRRIARSARDRTGRSVSAFRSFLQAREEALLELGDSDTLYDPERDERMPEEGAPEEAFRPEDFRVLPREKRLERKVRGVTGDTRLSPDIPDAARGNTQKEDGGAMEPVRDREEAAGLLPPDFRIRGLAGPDDSGADARAAAAERAGSRRAGAGKTGADETGPQEKTQGAPEPGRKDIRETDGEERREPKKARARITAGLNDIFRSGKDPLVMTSSGKTAGAAPSGPQGGGSAQPSQEELREAARKADELIGRTEEARQAAGSARDAGNGAGKGRAGAADAPVELPDGIGSRKKRSSDQEIAAGISRVAGEIAENTVEVKREYIFPDTELLAEKTGSQGGTTEEELRDTAEKLAQVFKTFGVNVRITDVICGPSVTRYELMPEMGVKVGKILALQDDIQLNLAVTDIRIEAPIPGKSAVGIEVPNRKPTGVLIRELLESAEFRKGKSSLTYAVGKDIGGRIIVADIAKMPHLLIAGSTGSGKSVFINTLIMSILYKAKPEDVKLIMIDPKVVELSVYNGIPHLFIPVVTDPKKAAGALNWAVAEMMARYQKFADCGVRDLKGYNARVEKVRGEMEQERETAGAQPGEEKPGELPEKMPQIVIIVDELADLMMVASSEVEDAICRLAQLARAAGIHLVIATQRPSVDVITGLIKANMPSRIAFAVSSGVDSRTILDRVGAEKLLGNGDMFFSPQSYKQPLRVQGAYVSDKEVADVVAFLKEQTDTDAAEQRMAERMEAVARSASSAAAGGGGDQDELFAQAGRFIIEKDKASIGMLQRWFKIGFNRAARIMDQLSEAGVVGPEEGTKPRKVEMSMEQFENYLEQN